MRVRSVVMAVGLLAGSVPALAQSKSGGPHTPSVSETSGINRQTGPVDGKIGDLTRGPGAAEIQPDRGLVPAVGGASRGSAAPDRGHVPTNQELAQGATPAIVELPPVPRTLEYAPEGRRIAGKGVGHE